ncbi:disintegrin and metalloproteinase domain-containing protein 10 isoform X2 [Aphidius gifuensis]|uniref:disintegrin and metalloproteinase domain-containing protein 10 isoform X2 n=1 Tax=Aphidius gifuensis TaxID=684658 RepID=UPI001CDC5D35|nr:disintegrin and metalloproteinase domain-containing protein 10 isoform X2 [Aphidius gifuensis]
MPSDICGYALFLLLLVPYIESARQLNEYIRHYEPLSYSTEKLHSNHMRAKRSTSRDNSINLKFRAHGKDFHIRLKRDTSTFSDNLIVEGPSGDIEEVDVSNQYSGSIVDEHKSEVFGSIIDGIFEGNIHSGDNGTYYVEKAYKYFPRHLVNESHHSVIYHENDIIDPFADRRQGGPSGCGLNQDTVDWMNRVQNSGDSDTPPPPSPASSQKKSTLTGKFGVPRTNTNPWSANMENPSHKYTRAANNHRTRRATRPKEENRNTCSLFIQTDPFLWRKLSEEFHKDAEKIREEILSLIAHHVTAVNYIYRDTRFDGAIEHRNIKFEVQRIKIDNDTCLSHEYEHGRERPNVFCMEHIDVSNFLNQHSLGNHEDFCLAYVFTYRDFTGGTLGLAWVASASGASGGICEKYKTYTETIEGMYQSTKRSLNTGIITFVNYNSRVPPKVSQLTLAHEIGHNFGSPHDFPIECRPGGLNGNFIMFASATSGDRPNNSQFSRCSISNISNVLDAMETGKKRNCFSVSRGAFCGNKIVEDGEECDCGYDYNECADKCCYPRQISEYDRNQNNSAKGCSRRIGTQCSPSQGPCCSSDTCQFVPAKLHMECKSQQECSYSSTCNGKSSECPQALPRANKTRCNEGTKLCIDGDCNGSICLEWNLNECSLTSSIIPNIDKRSLCELACQNGTDVSTCRSTREFADVVGLPVGGINLRPGSPCDNFQGYCDVFLKCRAVDAEGPLARLKNMLFNKETLLTLAQWMTENWWACLLMGISFIIFMGIFIKCCAVHTPSSNPKKPPARRISDTLRRPMNTLRRMRHPHGGAVREGGGGAGGGRGGGGGVREGGGGHHHHHHPQGSRSVPPQQQPVRSHGSRGPTHGYGEGRGAQYYPKASAPPGTSAAAHHSRSNHPELYAGAYTGSGNNVRTPAYEMRHHNHHNNKNKNKNITK